MGNLWLNPHEGEGCITVGMGLLWNMKSFCRIVSVHFDDDGYLFATCNCFGEIQVRDFENYIAYRSRYVMSHSPLLVH